MKIFDKLFGDKNNSIESLIENAKKQVNQHPTGHLPRPCRVALMQRIADPATVNKIFFECLKRVYPIWAKDYPDNPSMIDIIDKIDSFLYQKADNVKEIETFYNAYINYFQSIDGNAGLAGMTALSLCANLGYGTELTIDDCESEDDSAFDWQDWNPDFYASMAYAGGNPFIGKGDVNKRKEFWNWYLNTTLSLVSNPNQPVISLSLFQVITFKDIVSNKRKQTTNIESIKEKLKKVVDLSIEDLINQEGEIIWTKIEVNTCCLKAGISIETFFYNKDNQKTLIENVRNWPEEETIDFLNSIKKEMYNQFPKEGAWLESNMVIYLNKTYDISFNYDDYEKFTKRAKNTENLIREFDAYPRGEEFTPEWWRKILGKKAKYLK